MWAGVLGCIFFVGGNWLVTIGVKTVPSGVAAILVATTPLWTALLETCSPQGERLNCYGWVGLLVGLAGVILLKLDQPPDPESTMGAILIIGSALAWAFGSVLLRRHRQKGSHLVGAAWQMILGGGGLCLVGLALGELGQFTPDKFTPQGVYSFFHLLVFGSLVGFVAYNWLLGHVSTAHASTYAYVNPAVALLVGWLLGDHPISVAMVAGMCIILTGVALVRSQHAKKEPIEVRVGETDLKAVDTGIQTAPTSTVRPGA
jgi:drug/metabolite transporter (DMT)-like permease